MMATLRDVALRAGVSSSTVSHVLNSTRRVNPETRTRVENAIVELGYRHDPVARALAGGRSGTVGLVTSGLSNVYFGPLLRTISRDVTQAGLLLVVGESNEDSKMERRVVDSFLRRRVDGLIVAPSADFANDSYGRVLRSHTPLILVDRANGIACDSVTPENRAATQRLTDHIIEHGHRDIAVLVGLRGIDSTEERLRGFLDAHRMHRLEVRDEFILEGLSETDRAFEVTSKVLQSASRPTAVVSLNNAMTIGAMRAIRNAGIRISQDIVIAAYDDFEWSDLFEPQITSMGQDIGEMGRQAVSLLLRRIDGEDSAPEHAVVHPTLCIRNSCGCGGGSPREVPPTPVLLPTG